MFDFSFSEIALFVVVAMVFIRPKDLPVAIRTLSNGLKAMRRMASEFQSHVDEMVREADLSEARDQFRDLKSFNLRDRVTKAIDGDNSIRRSLELDAPTKASAAALPKVPPAPPLPPPPSLTDLETVPYNARPQFEPAVDLPVQEEPDVNEDVAGAPSILPPSTARRLQHERSRWRAPDILPPVRAIHAGRRIPIASGKDGE
ncbi:Sec-independent protein translocase protein TatB [Gluconobacter kondonii]|mgnify:FL=1|uniref:Sec-independent protein translocase protein TatB n=1 Tax=Gluconobacter kondonii TaxID=941463 RepID=UPI00197E9076|nr:Sec-independent protein translocase protein TatB [Gluconobacter kondonii]MBN3866074.1 twin-arginine translocase subunit TatB [Gluconobacter kondonii]MBS1052236.1 twin-arginine translocase subunit TatB [Gluconobacter kondonii]MBS1076237.1 twin-arginine translocase subunit TatB [Gluconobacter kondonii]MBS1079491.1 twin-arginine translocase subunit TatB [Gluconobacter kondonii]